MATVAKAMDLLQSLTICKGLFQPQFNYTLTPGIDADH